MDRPENIRGIAVLIMFPIYLGLLKGPSINKRMDSMGVSLTIKMTAKAASIAMTRATVVLKR